MASSHGNTRERVRYVLRGKHFPGGPIARARAFWHMVIRGYWHEVCGECGRPVGVVWAAESALWNYVIGGPAAPDDPGGVLCVRCFDAELQRRGLYVLWSPGPIDGDPPSGLAADLRAKLTVAEIKAADDWIIGKRWGPYPRDIEQGRLLDSFRRKIRALLPPEEQTPTIGIPNDEDIRRATVLAREAGL